MKKSDELKQRRSQLISSAEAIVQEVRSGEDGKWSDDQKSKFDGFKAEIEELDGQIERELNAETMELRK